MAPRVVLVLLLATTLPAAAWRPLRRAAAAALAPASILAGGALLRPGAAPGVPGVAPVAQRVAAALRPRAASALERPGAAKDEDVLLEQIADFFHVYEDPPNHTRFRFWFVREPWSQRPLEKKFSDVPVFLITNAAGNPYFTPTADGAVQIGRFYLDPRDAQDTLDEFLQEQATSGARLSVVSMSRALDIMADTADQNEDQEEEDLLDMQAEVEELEDAESGRIDDKRLRRGVEEVHRMRFVNDDEREALFDQEQQPYILWDFVGSTRSMELYMNLKKPKGPLPRNVPQLTKKGEPLPLVYGMRGLRTTRGGEEVRPFFFTLEDMGRAYQSMKGTLPEGSMPVEGLHWEAFELTEVLRNMMYGAEGWDLVSLEPMRDARKYVRRARKDPRTLSSKGHLIDPAATLGSRN